MESDSNEKRVEALLDVIMKKCLWQFHSRSWDRKAQNDGIMSKATQILCGEKLVIETPMERCHWVDASMLAETYRERFPWIAQMGAEEIRSLMAAVKEKLDYQTITGSLNLELADQHY